MDIKLKSIAIDKINELSTMFPGSGEYHKMKSWIEGLCKLPIGKYKKLPVARNNSIEEISNFMENTRKKFDELVYGHKEAKSQIIQLLAKLISNPSANGIVIGIYGPPGTGKTSLSHALCEALNLPFGFLSLAGINGEHFFKGFHSTFEGSTYGRIADILMSTQCMNPVLYFDELDKVSTTHHGEEVANLLVALTDFNQNHKFQDNYFGDIDLDLSKCFFVFSYNNEELVSPILRDRMIKIKANSYKITDKLNLAKEYLIPKIFKEFGFKAEELTINDSVITYIVNKVDEEDGARNMKRGLEEVVGSLNYKRILGELTSFPYTITQKTVDDYLLINKKKQDNISTNMMYI
jgi:ATP-dependent Lon protease